MKRLLPILTAGVVSFWAASSEAQIKFDAIQLVNGSGTVTLQAPTNGTFTFSFPTSSGVVLNNPLDGEGQLIYGGLAGVPTKLAAGTANYLLQSNGAAAPSWVNALSLSSAAFSAATPLNLTSSSPIVKTGITANGDVLTIDDASNSDLLTITKTAVGATVAAHTFAGTVITGNGSGLTDLDAGDIATGTVSPERGGTGVSNASGETITLGGAMTTGGVLDLSDHNLTLNTSGNTTLTLPTSGTVATTTNTVELQAATPGTQQTGHLNISGTGIFGGAVDASGTISTSAASAIDLTNTDPIIKTGLSTNGTDVLTIDDASNGDLMTITKTASGATIGAHTFAGTAITGDGSGLTNLNAGDVSTGTLSPERGGTGISNAIGETITLGGALTTGGVLDLADHNLTFNTSGNTTLTLPTSGTVATTTNTVELQATTPGAQQTGHLNVSGTGIFGAGVVIDGTAVSIGDNGNTATTIGDDANDAFAVASGGINISAAGIISDANSAVIIDDAQGFTINQGGASVTGGIDNNSGGITEAGAIAGATTIDATGTLTLSAATAVELSNTDPIVKTGITANGDVLTIDDASNGDLMTVTKTASGATVTAHTFAGTTITGDGSGLTNLEAGDIAVGILSTERGGTGLSIDPTAIADGELLIGSNAGDAFVKATLTGTTNRLSVTNGGGSITLDVAANYAGQNTIATVGTITSGTWEGTTVTDNFVANTLTISGGSIDNTPIGAATRNTGAFTTLDANSTVIASGATALDLSNTDPVIKTGIAANGNVLTIDDDADVDLFTITKTAVGATVAAHTFAGTAITGDGSGLTNLDAGDIGTGTLSPERGGTGVSNAAGETITLGGAITTGGALDLADHNLTFNTTGNTTLTLPTSGTIATTGNTVVFDVSSTQTSTTTANRVFDLASDPATGNSLGARITAEGNGAAADNATALTLSATSGASGTATGLSVSASSGADNHAINVTAGNVKITPFSSAGVVHNSATGVLSSSLIVNADVDASAAIAGSKVDPSFGNQTVSSSAAIALDLSNTNPTVRTGITANGDVLTIDDASNSDLMTVTKTASGATIAAHTFAGTNVTGDGSGLTNLDAGDIVTGTLSTNRGGTGLSIDPTAIADGELLIGNNTGDTYTRATLSGTTNRLSVTNGAGSITLNIDAGYVGQNSITTVGTIGTGTWEGSVVQDNYVANNLTISGGTVDNSPIGATTRSSGAFTTLNANNTITTSAVSALDLSSDVPVITTGMTATDGSDLLTIDDDGGNDMLTITKTGTATATVAAHTFAGTVITGNGSGLTNLDAGDITTGTLATSSGGTGLSFAGTTIADGDLLIGSNTGDGFVKTTLSGTANRLSVTNGAGSITLNIDPGYTGQNTITTVGTIGTGVWDGTDVADGAVADNLTISGGTIDNTPIGATTPSSGVFTTITGNGSGLTDLDAGDIATGTVSPERGGTGVSNASGETITLGGAMTTGGVLDLSDHNLTLNTSGNTTLTLPTSGTVATTTNTVTFDVSSAQTSTTAANRLFDLSSDPATGNALGARIVAEGNGVASDNATALTISSTAGASGTATGLIVSASGGSENVALNATSGDVRVASLTASRPVLSDGDKDLVSGSIDLANANHITGILDEANGGSGVNASAAANGTLLIGNGAGYTLTTLSDGNGITATEGAGSITLAIDVSDNFSWSGTNTFTQTVTVSGATALDLTNTDPTIKTGLATNGSDVLTIDDASNNDLMTITKTGSGATITAHTFAGTMFTGDGSGLTNLDVSDFGTGILSPEHGGTGVANATGETITLGGAIVTGGALDLADHNLTFNTSGNTVLTLPTSGTVATTTNTILLQATTPGTQQTGHLNVNGSGLFGADVDVTGLLDVNGGARIDGTTITIGDNSNASLTIGDDASDVFTVVSSGLNITSAGVISDGNSAVIFDDAQGLSVNQGGVSVTGGIDNNTGGVTEAGAISGVTTIGATSTITTSGATALDLTNTDPIIKTGLTTNGSDVLTIDDASNGDLMTITKTASGATIAAHTFAGTVITGDGSGLTNLDAGDVGTGVLTPERGGTGVSNATGETITLGGAMTTAGAVAIGSSTHNVTLNTTGNTTLTLPSSGTLTTSPGTSVITGKLSSPITTTAASTSLENATGLSFDVGTSESWHVVYYLRLGASGTAGLRFAIKAPTGSSVAGLIMSTTTATGGRVEALNGIDDDNNNDVHTVATQTGYVRIEAFITTAGTDDSDVILRWRETNSAQTGTINAGSYFVATKM